MVDEAVDDGSHSVLTNAEVDVASRVPPHAAGGSLHSFTWPSIRLEITPAGRPYLIAKVLPLLRREAFDSGGRSDLTDRQIIVRSTEQLEREASRVAPDPHVFERTAWILVEKLAFETPAE